jgi:two-component system, cell cycle response regulator DivK
MAEATVLLVTLFEDERAFYSTCLRAQGFDVVLADGPEHALSLAMETDPDVIVTRILQPGQSMNGLELLRRLKQRSSSAHVPVIIITSLMQAEFRSEAEEAGCDAYLLLPTLPDVLIAEIRRVVLAATRSIA